MNCKQHFWSKATQRKLCEAQWVARYSSARACGVRDAEINSFIAPFLLLTSLHSPASKAPHGWAPLWQLWREEKWFPAPSGITGKFHQVPGQGAENSPSSQPGECDCVRSEPTATPRLVGEKWGKHLVEEKAHLFHNLSSEKEPQENLRAEPTEAAEWRRASHPLLSLQSPEHLKTVLEHFIPNNSAALNQPLPEHHTPSPPPADFFSQQSNTSLLLSFDAQTKDAQSIPKGTNLTAVMAPASAISHGHLRSS